MKRKKYDHLVFGLARRRWIPATLLVLLLAGVAALVVLVPLVPAAACPQCFGLSRAGDRVFVGGGPAGGTLEPIAAARQRDRDYLGELRSDPRFLVCLSADCYRRIGGGGEKGRTLRHNVIALSPDGVTTTIASHELVHAELHQRLGGHYDDIPHWFHEGFAVVVSQDARYLPCPDYPGAVRRIRAGTSAGQGFYQDSACVVEHWLAANGGRPAALELLRRLEAGAAFTLTP
jgi:hypothetical protein